MNAETKMLSYLENKKIMVIVPHEDDEINIAGSVLFQLRKRHIPCVVVFMTNGDLYCNANRRQKEAEKSLRFLHIKKENVYFLGYPDVADIKNGCVYTTHIGNIFVSKSGYNHTYSGTNREEYIYSKKRFHHDYNKKNYFEDLKDIILEISPNIIITNDMDEHPNHKELSIMIEETICEIIKEQRGFNPFLWKTYAYDLAFYSADDYSPYNLQQSITSNTSLYHSLKWDARLRLPVPYQARTKILANNIIFQTMWKHHSQTGYIYASRIANSDKVYWMRRTDSKTYHADFTVSSGEKKYLNDYQLFCLKDDLTINYKKLWIPKKDDSQKKFRISFSEKIDVERIILYENMLLENDILDCNLLFSNGYIKNVRDIQHDGSSTIIDMAIQNNIEWIEFQIIKSTGEFAGLTEIEVYEPSIKELWFLKLCIDGNYVYRYYTDNTLITPTIIAYDIYGNIVTLPREKIHIVYCVNGEKKEILDTLNIDNINKRKIKISAYYDDEIEAYDEIYIIKASNLVIKRKICFFLNRILYIVFYIIDWFFNEVFRIWEIISIFVKH